MVIPNLMAESGAKNAYLEPDDAVFDWLARRLALTDSRDGLDDCRRRNDRPARSIPTPTRSTSRHIRRPERAGADGRAVRTTRRTSRRCRRSPARTSIRRSSAPAPTAGWRIWPRPPRCCARRTARCAGWRPARGCGHPGVERGAAGRRWPPATSRPSSPPARCSACPAAGRAWATTWASRPRARSSSAAPTATSAAAWATPAADIYLASPAVVAASAVLGRIPIRRAISMGPGRPEVCVIVETADPAHTANDRSTAPPSDLGGQVSRSVRPAVPGNTATTSTPT